VEKNKTANTSKTSSDPSVTEQFIREKGLCDPAYIGSRVVKHDDESSRVVDIFTNKEQPGGGTCCYAWDYAREEGGKDKAIVWATGLVKSAEEAVTKWHLSNEQTRDQLYAAMDVMVEAGWIEPYERGATPAEIEWTKRGKDIAVAFYLACSDLPLEKLNKDLLWTVAYLCTFRFKPGGPGFEDLGIPK